MHVPFPAHLTDQRFEYLLKKRVLQFVVLHVAVHRCLSVYIFQQLYIPVDEVRVQSTVQADIDNIDLLFQLSHQDAAFGAAVLALVLAGCGVAVDDQEIELVQGGHFAVSQFLKYFAFSDGIVEILRLLGGGTDFGKCRIDILFRILGWPGASSFLVPDVHYIPMVGRFSRPYHTAVAGNDIPAEYDQCFYGSVSRTVQCLFPPLPVLLNRIRVADRFVGIEVIHQ